MASVQWLQLMLCLAATAHALIRAVPRVNRCQTVTLLAMKKPYASISTLSDNRTCTQQGQGPNADRLSKNEIRHDPFARLKDMQHHPKLIVFDLDNTLWTPELYQIRQRNLPVAERDIRLFNDVASILSFCKASKYTMGIASRTDKVKWAHQLLKDFIVTDKSTATSSLLESYFDFVEIQPGSKKTHFSNMKQASGVSYSDMVFVDDDARLNLFEISGQLGVLCVHTPRGVTVEHFIKGMLAFNEQKCNGQAWMGSIVTFDTTKESRRKTGNVCQGSVKFYSSQKKFGFIVDTVSGHEFFVHESKVPANVSLQTGDVVSYEVLEMDSRGRASAVIVANSDGHIGQQSRESSNSTFATTQTPTALSTVTMPCFTMSQPYCALLLNGVKTVESRNNPMFMDVKPGTKVLLQCGQRDWHDVESYKSIIGNEMTVSELEKAIQLPSKFVKGAIVGVVTVGKTWRASEGERQSRDLQRKVLAPFDGIGSFCTEIAACNWLVKPIKMGGQPGIYTTSVPQDYISK
ncbi:hypothetical protein MPSEU_000080600 [Mayamaea pseudoterrestris]|nr:hypothetical protein MPSEU_000080600 [Mayamaea pseudoterrestris]